MGEWLAVHAPAASRIRLRRRRPTTGAKMPSSGETQCRHGTAAPCSHHRPTAAPTAPISMIGDSTSQQHPMMQQYLRHQGRAPPDPAGVASHGRFLRAVLRRRPARARLLDITLTGTRQVRRRADPDGRGAVSRRSRLPGEAGRLGRVGRDLRTDRRPATSKGPVERQVVRIVTPGTVSTRR